MKSICTFFLIFLLSTSCSSQDLLSRIDSLFSEYSKPGVPGASVLIVHNGTILLSKGYGLASLEENRPANAATNYRLASVTKEFTAMAVMILAERRKLTYDQVLTDFFPDFPSHGKGIAVRHLLNHTSGLIAYEDVMPETTTIQLLDKDVLTLMKKQDSTYFQPGSEFRYSNTGYALLALIVEKASGMRFADFLKTNIFNPLGMKNTLAFENGISTVTNRAYGYTQDTVDASRFTLTDQSMTSAVLGDGGIYSSLDDMFLWDQSLYSSPLVSPSAVTLAFAPARLNNDSTIEYGFGWRLKQYRGERCVYHPGSTIGFRNHFERYPEKHFSVLIFINRDNGQPELLVQKIVDMILFNE